MGLKAEKNPTGKFYTFRKPAKGKAKGRTVAKVHPPDKTTGYDHMHIYNKSGGSLNKDLKEVSYRSSEAHIPFGGD